MGIFRPVSTPKSRLYLPSPTSYLTPRMSSSLKHSSVSTSAISSANNTISSASSSSISTATTAPIPSKSPQQPHPPDFHPAAAPATITTGPKMSSDSAYASFLEQANQDVGDDSPSKMASSSAKKEQAVSIKAATAAVPDTLRGLDAFYVSEADEPFEGVSVKWEGDGLDEGELGLLVDFCPPVCPSVCSWDLLRPAGHCMLHGYCHGCLHSCRFLHEVRKWLVALERVLLSASSHGFQFLFRSRTFRSPAGFAMFSSSPCSPCSPSPSLTQLAAKPLP